MHSYSQSSIQSFKAHGARISFNKNTSYTANGTTTGTDEVLLFLAHLNFKRARILVFIDESCDRACGETGIR